MKPTGAQVAGDSRYAVYRCDGHTFTAWDVFRKDSSVRSRVEKSEAKRKPPMRLFHRPECLITDLATVSVIHS